MWYEVVYLNQVLNEKVGPVFKESEKKNVSNHRQEFKVENIWMTEMSIFLNGNLFLFVLFLDNRHERKITVSTSQMYHASRYITTSFYILF